jgi:hypothetical protein
MQNSQVEVGCICRQHWAEIHNVDVSHELDDRTIGVI